MFHYLYDRELSARWLQGFWPTIPLTFSALYLLTLFLLTRWMSEREPIKLQLLLNVWNTCLAVFSIVGFIQFAPSVLGELAKGGFVHSVCLIKPFSEDNSRMWMSLFTLSKFVEFGDTIFLVLRKAPLTFLHVYHHVTVSIYTWYGSTSGSSIGGWFCAMNLAVHSIMYTYFMLKGVGIRVPSVLAKVITSLQLVQFFVGLLCVLIAAHRLLNGEVCHSTRDFTVYGLLLYGSYFILFVNFFYHRYIKSKPKKKEI